MNIVSRKQKMKDFALIGVGGYIAPRHLMAIKETGNNLVAATDKSDSVGILDSYFPDACFFTEFERFDRHLEKLRMEHGHKLDYVSICSPNYLHDAHVRFGLRLGADIICEKPLVLNPWNIKMLGTLEQETGGKINCILQLRLHPSLIELKKYVDSCPADKIFDIDLTYITSRGNWYMFSWKGDEKKSGGIATNIGVHFFDMLTWIFGPVRTNTVHCYQEKRAAGALNLERARVKWYLSLNRSDLPTEPLPGKPATYRSIKIDGKEIEFSGGFTDLHTESYKRVLAGNGFGLDDVKASIEIVSDIRNAKISEDNESMHPFLKKAMEQN